MKEKLTTGHCIPAYGRSFTNDKAAIENFLAGKDWQLCVAQGGRYCSIRDFEKGAVVQLSYGPRRSCTVTVP